MFLRKLQANVSNHAVTLLLIDWYQYHTLLLFAVSDWKSRVTHSAVRCYRIISSVSLLILRVLSHGQIIYFYFAEVSTRTSSYTASTWCVCGTQKVRGVQSSSGALKPLALKWKSEILTAFYQQTYTFDVMRLRDSKGSVNLLRINCVLPTNLHTRRDAFAEINPPAGLSSVHSPTLGRVWYHAPWLRRYRRYRRCGQRLFGHLLW